MEIDKSHKFFYTEIEHICKNCANRPKICKNKVGDEDSCIEFISFQELAEYQRYNVPK